MQSSNRPPSTMPQQSSRPSDFSPPARPFRTAVLRGLGVVAAPLLTLVILLWIVRTVDYYILEPVVSTTRDLLARELGEVRTQIPDATPTTDPTVVSSGRQRVQAIGERSVRSIVGLQHGDAV